MTLYIKFARVGRLKSLRKRWMQSSEIPRNMKTLFESSKVTCSRIRACVKDFREISCVQVIRKTQLRHCGVKLIVHKERTILLRHIVKRADAHWLSKDRDGHAMAELIGIPGRSVSSIAYRNDLIYLDWTESLISANYYDYDTYKHDTRAIVAECAVSDSALSRLYTNYYNSGYNLLYAQAEPYRILPMRFNHDQCYLLTSIPDRYPHYRSWKSCTICSRARAQLYI